MKAKILTLPGDGIGPEIVASAVRVLKRTAEKFGHEFAFGEALIGGAAIDATGAPLPAETVKARTRRTRCCSARWAATSGTTLPYAPKPRSSA